MASALLLLAICILMTSVSAKSSFREENSVIIGNDDNLGEIINAFQHVIVYVSSKTCEHCKTFAPVYSNLSDAFKGNDQIALVTLSAENNEKATKALQVESFPSVYQFR